MLEPGTRRLFLDCLRPPTGYRVDRVVGTTFTLDLLAMLAVPLAFTFREAEDHEGSLTVEPLALLEAARRHASRIALFAHAGRTTVPRPGQSVLGFLEQSVIEVLPPRPNRNSRSGVFHPKLWVLRYTADGELVRYRLINQSRNLTFDRSWDATLVLDGELADYRETAFAANHAVADFIDVLPSFALGDIGAFHKETIKVFADELRRVRFEVPEGFRSGDLAFHPIGERNRSASKVPGFQHRPLLIISPFLDAEFLRSAAAKRPRSILVSRRDELVKISRETLERYQAVYQMRGALEPEAGDEDVDQAPLAGLHAKVFVIDDGWNARVFVGSANATSAALGPAANNVEFMVELKGPKNRFGIDAVLGTNSDPPRAGEFTSLIEPFDLDEAGSVPEDEVESGLCQVLDEAREILATTRIQAEVVRDENGKYTQTVFLRCRPVLPTAIDDVSCWPSSLGSASQKPLIDCVAFSGLALHELSAFLAIEVRASLRGRSSSARFVLSMPVKGMPDDRLQLLVAWMVGDHSRLIRLLWLLLAADSELTVEDLAVLSSTGGPFGASWGDPLPGLLERLLDTLAREPRRLEAVAQLIGDLARTEQGASILGDEFKRIWAPIWTVSRTRRR